MTSAWRGCSLAAAAAETTATSKMPNRQRRAMNDRRWLVEAKRRVGRRRRRHPRRLGESAVDRVDELPHPAVVVRMDRRVRRAVAEVDAVAVDHRVELRRVRDIDLG